MFVSVKRQRIMKTQISKIAEKRMADIKLNSKLSTAPAANPEFMKFMQENQDKMKCLDMLNIYISEMNRLSLELWKSN